MPETIAVHLCLAVLFFLIVNQLGKHSIRFGYYNLSFDDNNEDDLPFFNILFKSFSPVLLVYVFSYIFYVLDKNSLNNENYRIVVYYFIVRFLFNILSGRARLINWYRQVLISLLSFTLMYICYIKLINKSIYLLPTEQEISTAIWLGIVAFLYKTINQLSFLKNDNSKRIDKYVKQKFYYFRHKYGQIIDDKAITKAERKIVYSILIYESFNRGKLFRLIEKLFFFTGKVHTTGIMQVRSNVYLSDEESVKKGAERLVNKFRSERQFNDPECIEHDSYTSIRNTILDYNRDHDYYTEVEGILMIIEDLL